VGVDRDGDLQRSSGGCEDPGDEVDGERASSCKDVVDVVGFEDQGVVSTGVLIGRKLGVVLVDAFGDHGDVGE